MSDKPKRKKAPSYTQKTLKLYRDAGWTADVVEKWIPGANIRRDLFGVIDVVAVNGKAVIGIQSTSHACKTARYKKICAEPRALQWVRAGAALILCSWKKATIKKGGTAIRYMPDIAFIQETDFTKEARKQCDELSTR